MNDRHFNYDRSEPERITPEGLAAALKVIVETDDYLAQNVDADAAYTLDGARWQQFQYEAAIAPHKSVLQAAGLECIRWENAIDTTEVQVVQAGKFVEALRQLDVTNTTPETLWYLQEVAETSMLQVVWQTYLNDRDEDSTPWRAPHKSRGSWTPQHLWAGDTEDFYSQAPYIAAELQRLGSDQVTVDYINGHAQCYQEQTHYLAALLDVNGMFAGCAEELLLCDDIIDLEPMLCYLQDNLPESYLKQVIGENINEGYTKHESGLMQMAAEIPELKHNANLLAYIKQLDTYRCHFNECLGQETTPLEGLEGFEAKVQAHFRGADSAAVTFPPEYTTLHTFLTAAEQYRQDVKTMQGLRYSQRVERLRANGVDFEHFYIFNKRTNSEELSFLAQTLPMEDIGLRLSNGYLNQDKGKRYRGMPGLELQDGARLLEVLRQAPDAIMPPEAAYVFSKAIFKIEDEMEQWAREGDSTELQAINRNLQMERVLSGGRELADELEQRGLRTQRANMLRLHSVAIRMRAQQELASLLTTTWVRNIDAIQQPWDESAFRNTIQLLDERDPSGELKKMAAEALGWQLNFIVEKMELGAAPAIGKYYVIPSAEVHAHIRQKQRVYEELFGSLGR